MTNQNREQIIHDILETIDEGIHAVDENGTTVFYNEIAAYHDGLKVEEVVGKHLFDVFPSLSEETSTLLKAIKTKKPIYHHPQTYINIKGEKIETVNTSLPILSEDKVIGAVEIAKDYSAIKRLTERLADLQKQVHSPPKAERSNGTKYVLGDIITASKNLLLIKTLVKKAAKTSSNVLVYGETGTGKELIVQAIHNESQRRDAPFIAQNCAALPEALLESLLFGTAKGSYTGAVDRAGLFELSHGGTLFLDELQSMPLNLQAKLLRVIDDGTIRRIGSSHSINVDVRVIAAMNISPEQCLSQQKMREDLYYRLNVFSINLPPLRERPLDLPILISSFINMYNHEFQKRVGGLTDEGHALLKRHPWPGNVRELKHCIEYAMNMCDDNRIHIDHLPPYLLNVKETAKEPHSLHEKMSLIEKEIIQVALAECEGNILKSAKLLQIPRQTLQYKVKKYFPDQFSAPKQNV
ncbi:sigma-54 interaction domain-containing protein [Peribacillus frigoritolerans]|uniref:sigma-54 interaction domain-containing protein n=1 Tax=Peribacillus frigoritolerans TaxID=450367 RepID=UPI00105A39B8|nr:sigma 54-interacting transcriptional regulator [Peribacillus frigoritolerans]TDL82929.1 PAS domain S-box protein [Peribacillus frigoritolerans]